MAISIKNVRAEFIPKNPQSFRIKTIFMISSGFMTALIKGISKDTESISKKPPSIISRASSRMRTF